MLIVLFMSVACRAQGYAPLRNLSAVFDPQNYINQLPSLSLPYIPALDIPPIAPSPVATTRVVKIVTAYVKRGPLCLKVTRKKAPCEAAGARDYYVTRKENKRRGNYRENKLIGSQPTKRDDVAVETPALEKDAVDRVLIEDRLDHLAEILPHYKRRRVYATSTVTVTKVIDDYYVTATLVARNCVPHDVPLCSKRGP